MPLIEITDVCKTYDLGEIQVEALANASLSIEKGEFVALIGPSGSGKSTLMNMLGCLDRPTSGSYLLAGEEIATMSRDDRAKIRNRRIGFVFQNFNLLSRTSAIENVELPLLYSKGISARQRRARAAELLTKIGLGDRLHHHPSQLSGGQQQRVAIARALVNSPDILMGDEPTGNLDSRTSQDVIRLFQTLNAEHGITVILVTHDQDVARHASRTIVLRDGKIVADTTQFTQALHALHASGAAPVVPWVVRAIVSMTTVMRRRLFRQPVALACLLAALCGAGCAAGIGTGIVPERQSIDRRESSRIAAPLAAGTRPPPTVTNPQQDAALEHLSLDDAIRRALANSEVVRVLAGATAVPSGRTIYDPAISHTAIDQEQGRFDPTLDVTNAFDGFEQPLGLFDPADPNGARIGGPTTDDYDLGLGLSKTTAGGGVASLDVGDTWARFGNGVFPLSPQDRSSAGLGFTQPLLQGGGAAANLAPIVIARLQTRRSFFQFKDGVQELVRGVIDAYWGVVFSRTDVWARRQQVDQGRQALARSEARMRGGIGSAAEVAQARLALANFNATRIGAEADLLTREAALRNLLGVPPTDASLLVPISAPSFDRLDVNWDEIVSLAEDRRPDLIELKLIVEADEQFLIQARNKALPRVDALALYRWNGLEGETPSGVRVATRPGEFTDWTLGVNFSVPLGLRTARAAVREQQLLIARDRANLDQGLHAAVHELATSIRDLDRFYEQYVAYRAARQAARVNLDQQFADFRAGRAIFLNVLQAITDWGNAVSLEAQALTAYNTEQASLQRRTGTILETHGVYFAEERFGAVGPLGRVARPRCYPKSLPPSGTVEVFPGGLEPSEAAFDLDDPLGRDNPPSEGPSPDPTLDLPEPAPELAPEPIPPPRAR